LHKLGFLVRKYTIWQYCARPFCRTQQLPRKVIDWDARPK
jgi:hypothetical protein